MAPRSSQPYENLINTSALDATAPSITSRVFYPKPNSRNTSVYIYTDFAATTDVEIQLYDGTWAPIVAAEAVAANDLTVVSLDLTPLAMRVIVYPDVPGAGALVVVDASYSGAAPSA